MWPRLRLLSQFLFMKEPLIIPLLPRSFRRGAKALASMPTQHPVRIVILGGGFAGISAATELGRKTKGDPSIEVHLVNNENYFVFQPLLPEVVSCGIEPSHVLNHGCRSSTAVRDHWALEALFPRDITMIELQRTEQLKHAHFRPGEIIIRQGEIGDRFYIIESGEVEIVQQDPGKPEKRLGTRSTGESFGELALLKHLPRTATVRCLTPVNVVMFNRRDFDTLGAATASSVPTWTKSSQSSHRRWRTLRRNQRDRLPDPSGGLSGGRGCQFRPLTSVCPPWEPLSRRKIDCDGESALKHQNLRRWQPRRFGLTTCADAGAAGLSGSASVACDWMGDEAGPLETGKLHFGGVPK